MDAHKPMVSTSSVVPDSDLQSGDTFEREPGVELKRSFLKHVRDTGQPETFPGLSTLPVPCYEPYSIIAKFEVERKRRHNGEQIACAICSPRKGKFLDGRLVYHPHDRRIRLIGHECADSHVNQVAQEAYETKQRNAANDEFLLENFFFVPDMLGWIDELRDLADHYQRIHAAFCAQAPKVQAILRRQSASNDGSLVVEISSKDGLNQGDDPGERIGPAGFKTSGGHSTGHIERIGNVHGRTVLKSNCSLVAQIDEINELLRPYRHSNDDEAVALLSGMSDVEKALCVANIRAASKLNVAVEAELSDFSNFFTPKNFETIQQWGQHPKNPQRVHAIVEGSVYQVGSSSIPFKVEITKRPPSRSKWPEIKEPAK